MRVEVAYAIGVAKPVSVLVETFGTGVIDEERVSPACPDISTCAPLQLSTTWIWPDRFTDRLPHTAILEEVTLICRGAYRYGADTAGRSEIIDRQSDYPSMGGLDIKNGCKRNNLTGKDLSYRYESSPESDLRLTV